MDIALLLLLNVFDYLVLSLPCLLTLSTAVMAPSVIKNITFSMVPLRNTNSKTCGKRHTYHFIAPITNIESTKPVSP